MLEPLPLSALVQRAGQAFPGLEIEGIYPANRLGRSVTLTGQAEALLVADTANRVHLDPYTGEIIEVRRGDELSIGQRLIETADPLHFGQFGGLLTRTIWFLAGLALSVGILVGAFIWWLRVTRGKVRFFRKSRGWTAAALLLNIGLLVLAVFSTISFIGNQVGGPRDTIAPTPLGEAAVGPWQVQAFRHGPVGGESLPISLTFPGGHPNYRAAVAWIGDEPAAGPTALRGFVDQLQGQVAMPADTDEPRHLHIRMEDWSGRQHTAAIALDTPGDRPSVAIPATPGTPGTPGAPEAPGAPRVPLGVWAVIATFVGICTAPTLAWLIFVR
ncbi:MAG TPA: PepSY domain-containing protein [Phycisphaeraceae bacterium]